MENDPMKSKIASLTIPGDYGPLTLVEPPRTMCFPMDGWEAIEFTHDGKVIRFTPDELMAALFRLKEGKP